MADEGYPKQLWQRLVRFEILPLVITYNKSLVKSGDVPKGFGDLLDPKWKAKAAIDVIRTIVSPRSIKKWSKEDRQLARQFMNGNQALIRRGRTVQTQLLASCEYPIASEVMPVDCDHGS